MEGCASRLSKSRLDEFAELDKERKVKSINMPRLFDVSVNLVCSVDASNRRSVCDTPNLWPYFKYESRSTTMEARAQSHLLSSRVDIMSDQLAIAVLLFRRSAICSCIPILFVPDLCVEVGRNPRSQGARSTKGRVSPRSSEGGYSGRC